MSQNSTDMDDTQAMSEIFRAKIPFDMTFKVYDYTAAYGEYINEDVYYFEHDYNSIDAILDPTMQEYHAQVVMWDNGQADKIENEN